MHQTLLPTYLTLLISLSSNHTYPHPWVKSRNHKLMRVGDDEWNFYIIMIHSRNDKSNILSTLRFEPWTSYTLGGCLTNCAIRPHIIVRVLKRLNFSNFTYIILMFLQFVKIPPIDYLFNRSRIFWMKRALKLNCRSSKSLTSYLPLPLWVVTNNRYVSPGQQRSLLRPAYRNVHQVVARKTNWL